MAVALLCPVQKIKHLYKISYSSREEMEEALKRGKGGQGIDFPPGLIPFFVVKAKQVFAQKG